MEEDTPFAGVKIEYGERECLLRKATYRLGMRTALLLIDAATGKEVTRVTANILGVSLKNEEVLIKDYGPHDGILEVLETAGVVKNTGRSVQCGNVVLPICVVLTPEHKYEQDRTSLQFGQTFPPRRRDMDREP